MKLAVSVCKICKSCSAQTTDLAVKDQISIGLVFWGCHPSQITHASFSDDKVLNTWFKIHVIRCICCNQTFPVHENTYN